MPTQEPYSTADASDMAGMGHNTIGRPPSFWGSLENNTGASRAYHVS